MQAHSETRVAFDPLASVRSELEKLSVLSLCRQGLPVYYATLLTHNEEVLRVAAMSALLELSVLKSDQWDLAVQMSRYDAVKSRAFKFFISRFEYELAGKVVEAQSPGADGAHLERMRAENRRDLRTCQAVDRELFLATGMIEHLYDAQRTAEMMDGWRAGVPCAVTTLLAQPADPRGPYRLFGYLFDANQIALVELLCDKFQSAGLYPHETTIFRAFVSISRGQAKDAIKALEAHSARNLNNSLKSLWYRAKAQAHEALEQYRPAYQAYVQMNEVGAVPEPADLSAGRRHLAQLDYEMPELPADDRSVSHFMMVGFPRSGTTLLENALAAHPQIETFEEVPAFSRAVSFIDRNAKLGLGITRDVALTARQRYYEEIDRQMFKKTARVFIDKLPLNASAIKFLERLLPSKRYIFSIRHPHDVVLSCFRQHFAHNKAMDNFRRFPEACRFYDFVMAQWFDVFSLSETERVTYVRYEDLVGDFKSTTSRVLNFVGAQWDEKVLDFAARAQNRSAKTPSYQKVRGGLSVGVQSSWRNYSFLFKGDEAALLSRWVEHFGYLI